ncbi:MAG: sensor histidine kinase, partial [Nostoc sp.]
DWSEGVFKFEGKPAKLVTAIDITERRQAEIKVRQALEQEKQLSELRSRFVCMVSHEFRNPLHLISFSTSALKRQTEEWIDEKKLKCLNRIQTAVEHLTELMDDVLILGISDASKIIFEPRVLNLEQFCGDLVTQFQLSHATDCT